MTKEYVNVGEFLKSLDDTIAEYRKTLGELLRKIEELRIKSEQESKLRSILSKLGVSPAAASNEINLRNVKILVNPLPQQELLSLESAVEALNNKITLLTGIRKDLEALAGLGDAGVRIIVVYIDDVPRNIILKFA
ncbi:MAG: hypothetical protein QXS24_06020 [Desulfurococcaceae archaeon]